MIRDSSVGSCPTASADPAKPVRDVKNPSQIALRRMIKHIRGTTQIVHHCTTLRVPTNPLPSRSSTRGSITKRFIQKKGNALFCSRLGRDTVRYHRTCIPPPQALWNDLSAVYTSSSQSFLSCVSIIARLSLAVNPFFQKNWKELHSGIRVYT